MSDLLSVGGNSVKNNQSALTVVSNNIANAQQRAMSAKISHSKKTSLPKAGWFILVLELSRLELNALTMD